MKSVDTHELSEPWAQRAWKVDYSIFSGFRTNKARRNARIRMRKVRREAALERKLAAAQRTIEAQAKRIAELESNLECAELEAIDGYMP